MERKKSYKQFVVNEGKCDICKSPIMVDPFGNNTIKPCEKCGWLQNVESKEYPTLVMHPSKVSYASAIEQFRKGNKIKPTLGDFIGMYNAYGEVEFRHKGKLYIFEKQDKYELAQVYVEKETESGKIYKDASVQEFDSLEEFESTAQIGGAFLRDIWDEVTGVNWLQ